MPFSLLRSNPTKIFISYRRAESEAQAGRLFEQLSARFDPRRVFADRESIGPGQDFLEEIEAAVNSCKILLAVIGPEWLNCVDGSGKRRLDDPEDVVRLEIAAALRRKVRVIPVLIGGATMPDKADLPDELKALARRQAWPVSDTHWRADVERLIEKIAGDIKRRKYLVIAGALVLLGVLVALGGFALTLWGEPDAAPFGRLFDSVTPTPVPSPPASPPPAEETGETPPESSATPSSTPRRTATPKPPRTPQKPKGNCNQWDYIDNRCQPEGGKNQ